MLTVHHLGISQSDRIVWLCEELGIAYDLRRYERDPVTRMAPPAYRAIHPFGTAPAITDGELVLGESAAIVDYIVAKHGGGRLTLPPADPHYADWLFWFHFANGSLMPAGMVDLVIAALGVENDTTRLIAERSDRAFAMIEARLGEATWFAGDTFTTADIMMLFPLSTMRRFVPRDLSAFPDIRAWLGRVGDRPAFRAAMAKADPGIPQLLD